MSEIKRVLLVGHCGPDTWALKSWVERTLKDLPVQTVSDEADLEHADGDTLLLINRVLDGGFDEDEGVDLIRRLNERPNPPLMMLVSNYADAQGDAEDAGALPGFGKSDLGSPQATRRLTQAANGVRSDS